MQGDAADGGGWYLFVLLFPNGQLVRDGFAGCCWPRCCIPCCPKCRRLAARPARTTWQLALGIAWAGYGMGPGIRYRRYSTGAERDAHAGVIFGWRQCGLPDPAGDADPLSAAVHSAGQGHDDHFAAEIIYQKIGRRHPTSIGRPSCARGCSTSTLIIRRTSFLPW